MTVTVTVAAFKLARCHGAGSAAGGGRRPEATGPGPRQPRTVWVTSSCRASGLRAERARAFAGAGSGGAAEPESPGRGAPSRLKDYVIPSTSRRVAASHLVPVLAHWQWRSRATVTVPGPVLLLRPLT